MPKVPESVVKESYLLRSTFTYNRLRSEGYFELFMKIRKLAHVEGAKLNWDDRNKWSISEEAWDTLRANKIYRNQVGPRPCRSVGALGSHVQVV